MPSRTPDGKLRQLARERIENSRLVCGFRTPAWRRPCGSNLPCSLCDKIIGTQDLEYEVGTPEGGDAHVYRFHFFCHAIWIEECAHHKGLDSDA